MASLTDLLSAMQNGVQGINNLVSKIGTVFPQTTASSTVVPSSAGGISFSSSQPAAFMIVQSSSGGTFKMALYNQ